MSTNDSFPPRTAPMTEIVDAFLYDLMERNPDLSVEDALWTAEQQAARYAR